LQFRFATEYIKVRPLLTPFDKKTANTPSPRGEAERGKTAGENPKKDKKAYFLQNQA